MKLCKIKKAFITILTLLCCISLFTACNTDNDDNNSSEPQNDPNATQGLQYELSADDSYYILTGLGVCTDEEIVVASLYNGKPVKEIAEEAFKECADIKEITIPNSVVKIGNKAFLDCSELQKVQLPNTINKIPED